MLDGSLQPVVPPLYLNLARSIRRDWGPSQPTHPSTAVFIRSYLFGYAGETLPALLRLVVVAAFALRRRAKHGQLRAAIGPVLAAFRRRAYRVLKNAGGRTGLALFFGVTLGGSVWLDELLRRVLYRILRLLKRWRASKQTPPSTALDATARRRVECLSTFLSTAIVAFAAFGLQSSAKARRGGRTAASKLPLVAIGNESLGTAPQASRLDYIRSTVPRRRYESGTLDFTLFLLVRALDTLIRSVYTKAGLARYGFFAFLAHKGDVVLFVSGAWRLMYAWFYKPWLLPPSYDRWIHSMARIDERLLVLLRHARQGTWTYGQVPTNAEAASVGPSLCKALGVAEELGMPDRMTAFPCQVAHDHLGNSTSCEVNLLRRWLTAWQQSMGLYLPVHFLPLILFSLGKLRQAPVSSFGRALLGAGRSSAFLATFVAGVWGGICYGRTRIGPKIYPNQQFWDGGGAMLLGSFLCGFSVLIENKRRRGEMALFVAPRALYAILDELLPSFLREGDRVTAMLERLVFSVATAILVTTSVHKPQYIRGIVRSVMRMLVGTWVGVPSVSRLRKDV